LVRLPRSIDLPPIIAPFSLIIEKVEVESAPLNIAFSFVFEVCVRLDTEIFTFNWQ
jgi:hypothetical protein